MNRFLCEPHALILHNVTAYHFSQKLSVTSIYILPILALVGNLLTLLVIQSNRQLNRSPFSIYVKSMAVSDTLVLLFKLLSYQNKTSHWLYLPSLCIISKFFGEASLLLSVWTIVTLTIERTLVVLFPLYIKSLISAYRTRMVIIFIAILAMLFSSRSLFIPIDKSTGQTRRCHPRTHWRSYIHMNTTITEIGYCYIPLTIVIIGNLLTVCTIKRAFIRRQDLLASHSHDQQKRQISSNENQLMLMLLIVTLIFIVCFVPFTIVNLMTRFGLPFNVCFTQKTFEIYILIRVFCDLLKDFNCCTNFLVYCISGHRFRNAFFSFLKCRDRHRSSIISFRSKSQKTYSEYLLQKYGKQKPIYSSLRISIKESQM